MDTLYARLGGPAAVARLVFDFYDRVLKHERLAAFFATTDMARLVDHQARFLGSVMGGPAAQSDGRLREVHAGLDIRPEDFDAMLGLLQEALQAHAVAPADVEHVMAEMRRRRPLIVRARETSPSR
ncbi:Cyanoglobin Hemoglobin-like protein HbN [Caenispirillum salinarum AK4]|uniref:Cyanoglobin Hemoglobin-like protein HbN n=1 Tax=Caenispirillum salinarum AK4 TaxID=1238182 RepID=K9HGA2_9PROT|nr:group 1 truncated hemoglobin [Caenispirillum salinarum]EKV29493.1 Cyanoglobin Hemoglobin-like protein HbN [Caenispirillum salinarum AK4]